MLLICFRFIHPLRSYSLDHIGYHLIELGCILGCNDRNTSLRFHSLACIPSHFAARTRYLNIFCKCFRLFLFRDLCGGR